MAEVGNKIVSVDGAKVLYDDLKSKISTNRAEIDETISSIKDDLDAERSIIGTPKEGYTELGFDGDIVLGILSGEIGETITIDGAANWKYGIYTANKRGIYRFGYQKSTAINNICYVTDSDGIILYKDILTDGIASSNNYGYVYIPYDNCKIYARSYSSEPTLAIWEGYSIESTLEHHTNQISANKTKISNLYDLIEGVAYSRDEETSNSTYFVNVPQNTKIGSDGYGVAAVKKVFANVTTIASVEFLNVTANEQVLCNFGFDADGTIISGSNNRHYLEVKAGDKYFVTQARTSTTYTTYYYADVPAIGSTPIATESQNITSFRSYNNIHEMFTALYDGYILVGIDTNSLGVYKPVEIKTIPDAVQALDGWNVGDLTNDLYNYIDFEACTFQKVCEKDTDGNIVKCEEVVTDLVPLGIDEDFALFKVHNTYEGEYGITASITKVGRIRFYNNAQTSSSYGKTAFDVIFETEVSNE